MKKAQKYFSKNCLKKVLRTFLQTSFGYLITNITMHLGGIDYCNNDVVKSSLIGLAIASASAGLAAVMNIEKGEYNNG